MKKIATVKELITFLLDFNMDAFVNVNINGVLKGIALSDISWCCGDGEDAEPGGYTRRDAKEISFDVTPSEEG